MEKFRKSMRHEMDELKKIVVGKHLTATVRPMSREPASPTAALLTGPLSKKLEVLIAMLPLISAQKFNDLDKYLEDKPLRHEFVSSRKVRQD